MRDGKSESPHVLDAITTLGNNKAASLLLLSSAKVSTLSTKDLLTRQNMFFRVLSSNLTTLFPRVKPVLRHFSPLGTGKRLIIRQPKLSLQHPPPLERRDVQVQTGYTGRRVTNSRFQFLGAKGEYLSDS